MKRVYGRAGVRYVITKFSGMDSLPNFLNYGAPLRARFARGSSANNNNNNNGMNRSRREWWKVKTSKILWDFTVQCDRKIEARRPDIVFIHKKEREVVIINVAIQGDDRVEDKELEKLEKYQLLKVRRMRKVIVVPFVIGALGAVSVNFKEYMKRIGVNVRLSRKQYCWGQQRY